MTRTGGGGYGALCEAVGSVPVRRKKYGQLFSREEGELKQQLMGGTVAHQTVKVSQDSHSEVNLTSPPSPLAHYDPRVPP